MQLNGLSEGHTHIWRNLELDCENFGLHDQDGLVYFVKLVDHCLIIITNFTLDLYLNSHIAIMLTGVKLTDYLGLR